MIVLLSVFGLFSVLPVLLSVFQSFKPMNELFLYPPRFFVRNPTLSNYKQLFVLMSGTWVPFSRYIFNTVLITVAGTAGNILVCSLAAYPLAKHRGLPGGPGNVPAGDRRADVQCGGDRCGQLYHHVGAALDQHVSPQSSCPHAAARWDCLS